jgi:multisubunit Na+/H+ antiporter MnhE subunit
MSELAVAGLLVGLVAGVFVFALARASTVRELAWRRLRQQAELAVVFAESHE